MVKGLFPTCSLVYFLQTVFNAVMAFSSCFMLFKEKVLAVLLISFSNPNLNSSKLSMGSPFTDITGESYIFPLLLTKIVTSKLPLIERFLRSLIDFESSKTLTFPST